MLYSDQVAATEDEAVNVAVTKLRLNREDCVVRSVTETPDGVQVRVEAKRSRGEESLALLRSLLEKMGINVELFYIESFDKIMINVKGPHLGLIIGKGGSTLEALETILSAIHNRKFEHYKPILVNPGGYRENKRKALQGLVRKAVDEACDDRRVCLPSMSQRDRRQVHQILKDFPGFRSRSFGEGNDRRVFIFEDGIENEDSPPTAEELFILSPPDHTLPGESIQQAH